MIASLHRYDYIPSIARIVDITNCMLPFTASNMEDANWWTHCTATCINRRQSCNQATAVTAVNKCVREVHSPSNISFNQTTFTMSSFASINVKKYWRQMNSLHRRETTAEYDWTADVHWQTRPTSLEADNNNYNDLVAYNYRGQWKSTYFINDFHRQLL
jgi:hypothetical protein